MKIVNKLNPEDVYSPEGVKLFSFNELACRSSGIYAFHGNFLDELIKLRIVLNKPMSITSACRSLEHNMKLLCIHMHSRACNISLLEVYKLNKLMYSITLACAGARAS